MVPYKIEKEVLLNYAASLEKNSEHPLGKAITDYYHGNEEVKDFKILPGHGLRGLIHDKEVLGGSIKMMEKHIPDDVEIQAKNMAKEGKTPLFFSYDDYYLGMICVADTMKEDSPQAIKEMQNMGIQVVMLTGDNKKQPRQLVQKQVWMRSLQGYYLMVKRVLLEIYRDKVKWLWWAMESMMPQH